MADYTGGYNNVPMKVEMRTPPVMEVLRRELQDAERRVSEIQEAIKALEDNPEFQKLYDVLSKVVRY